MDSQVLGGFFGSPPCPFVNDLKLCISLTMCDLF